MTADNTILYLCGRKKENKPQKKPDFKKGLKRILLKRILYLTSYYMLLLKSLIGFLRGVSFG